MLGVRLWVDGTIAVGERIVPLRQTSALLAALVEERSIGAAARRLGLSYRVVWGRLAELDAALGSPVVAKTRGHGTVLTQAGASLQEALAAAAAALAEPLDREAAMLRGRLEDGLGAQRQPWRLACSHDPHLMEMLEGVPDIVVAVVGSDEALRRLADDQADGAGFHGAAGASVDDPDPTLFRVHPLLRREQGLMIAAGNPLGLTAIGDLTRPDVVFVNRQKGSGTRRWTDHLLGVAGIDPAAVRGYAAEEFTHHAVAATVAAGMAQAGIGVRSAAERFGLGFIPLAEEIYKLAVRRDDEHPAIKRLLAGLRDGVRCAPA